MEQCAYISAPPCTGSSLDGAACLHLSLPLAQVLAWMEQCAYISASRMRGPHCLTASMDSITFGRATRVGDILYLTSQVMCGWLAEGMRVGDILYLTSQVSQGLLGGIQINSLHGITSPAVTCAADRGHDT